MRFIARAYAAKHDFAAAEQWGWRAIAEAPHLREPYMELAWLLYRMQDWEGVIYLTGRALKITELTPLDALNTLYHLQSKLNNRYKP